MSVACVAVVIALVAGGILLSLRADQKAAQRRMPTLSMLVELAGYFLVSRITPNDDLQRWTARVSKNGKSDIAFRTVE